MHEVERFVLKPKQGKKFCQNIIYSDDQIQPIKSVLCGYYVLAFLNFMKNQFHYNLQYTLNQFRSKFKDDTKKK
jgi:hypothetical protein